MSEQNIKGFLDNLSKEDIEHIKDFFERIYKRKPAGRKQSANHQKVLDLYQEGMSRREISNYLNKPYVSVCRILEGK